MSARRQWIGAIATPVVLVVALEVACRAELLSHVVVIPPTQMLSGAAQIVTSGDGWRSTILPSLVAILCSAVIAVGIGTALAIALSRGRWLRAAFEPYLIVLPAIPIFALYPMFIAMFGQGSISLVLTGVLLGVVPMLTQALAGLDSLPDHLYKLSAVYHLGTWARLRMLLLPGMAPALLTGARLAAAYSAIGVIAAELILSTRGLGQAIHFGYESFDLTRMYGAILVVLAIIAGIYLCIGALQRVLLAGYSTEGGSS